MEDLLQAAKNQLRALRPSFASKHPHFNFITMHYFWVIGFSIIGSILIYASGKGEVAYIDALFFASGANTQAGLNTVDVNKLNTFQQIVIMLSSMISNPITINSFVVFLRLYWFEKRFQGIVQDARQRRLSIAKTRSNAKNNTPDLERGVNGRHITVMHNTAKSSRMTNDGILLDEFAMNGAGGPNATHNGGVPYADEPPVSPRDATIRFADQVTRSDALEDRGDDTPLPRQRSDAEHIAILERQRKRDKGVLRIPGPRDADRGVLPEEFEDEEDDVVAANQDGRTRRASSLEPPRLGSVPARSQSHPAERQQTITIAEPAHPKREEITEDAESAVPPLSSMKFHAPQKDGEKMSHTETNHTQARIPTMQRIKTALTQSKDNDVMPYLSWQPTIGRNSEFLGLTEEQREELGGIEYRSLKTLAGVATLYFWGFWLLALVCLLPWILVNNDYYQSIIRSDGQSPVWWGFFTANSAFTDLGFTLTPDSMSSFSTARFPLLIMSFLIIIGNTGFPIMLRLLIWLISLCVPRGSGLWEELQFLLDHPRRCFTLLFPSDATWWLFAILVILNGADLILFIVLDLGTGAVAQLPLDIRFLDGWFQATSTRTAGFGVINLSNLHPAVQTSYMIMMYISVFPIAISIRRTNVYEEKSLGVYDSGGQDEDDQNQGKISYVGTHLRRQLSFDLWYIFIGYFILTISEGERLMSGDISMFAVLFEIVSAYGTVGLSLGYATVNASLCSQFSVVGKLVVIAMMIRGRHRGLPYGLDRAILLPSETLHRREAEDADARLQRRQSGLSLSTTRPLSLSRMRSRSFDRRNVFAQFLHPGPSYPAASHSMSKADNIYTDQDNDDVIRHTASETPSEDNDTKSDLIKPTTSNTIKPRARRAETQPILPH